MNRKTRNLAHGAILAALYAALTHLQNLIFPGSASWAVQLRLSEALCVLACFTPAAIPGLSLGCGLFNLAFAAALPLDALTGSLATLLATFCLRRTRRLTLWGLPLPGMVLAALSNALLVGWELTVYVGGSFPLNALYVGLGELAVLLSAGSGLYYLIRRRHLDQRLF